MYLEAIVKYINSVLKANITGSAYQQGRYFGISKLVQRNVDNRVFSVILDNDGNDETDFVNDKYSLSVYHRCLSSTLYPSEVNQALSFGDGAAVKRQVYNMIMVVYGDRERLRITNEELSSRMYLAFPERIPDQGMMIGIKQLSISPLSQNNISQGAGSVSAIEGIACEPENILFSIAYKVDMNIDSGCINCVTYSALASCINDIVGCLPVVTGTQFITFQSLAGVAAYNHQNVSALSAIVGKTISVVWIDRSKFNPTEYTFVNNTLTITAADILPLDAGIYITIAFQ